MSLLFAPARNGYKSVELILPAPIVSPNGSPMGLLLALAMGRGDRRITALDNDKPGIGKLHKVLMFNKTHTRAPREP